MIGYSILDKKIKTCILIPTFNPDSTLTKLLSEMLKLKLKNIYNFNPDILIIDDGSNKKESLKILKKINSFDSVEIISHKRNLGKGTALKTGFKKLKNLNYSYVVTADSDGQHSAKDVFKILEKSIEGDEPILGARDFSSPGVPFKSKLGNNLTNLILKIFYNVTINDTQTGLRAFPSKYFSFLLGIQGNRYEYEFNCLIELMRIKTLKSVPIETLYFQKNRGSNFRPVIDSLLVYFVLLRHSCVAFAVASIDFLLIYLLFIFYPGPLSFLIIRVITLHLYYYFMKKTVFKTKGKVKKELLRFYLIAFLNLVISWIIFKHLFFDVQSGFTFAYLGAVLAIYFLNFFIQKGFIFK